MRNQCLRQLRCAATPKPARPFSTSAGLYRAFREGDVVLLRSKKDIVDGTLLKLQAAKTAHTHRGVIDHASIIGKETRQVVRSSKGFEFRVHEPTLAEYVRLTPRLVTPLYPSDTNLIVSLLDIHVDTPSSALNNEPPFEILEAGTGHGALTLHLARAIHAANPPLAKTPDYATNVEEPEDAVYLGESMSDLQDMALDSWKPCRRAIVHTLDISSKHAKHAKKIVQGFRHGLYAGNVDFHVGDVSAWIASQRVTRKTEEPFLNHVFLDLPNAETHLANVAPALRVDGLLAVFNPSITQIAQCVELIREEKMPYLLDRVVELGAGTIREWDVRAVRPRSTLKKPDTKELPDASDVESVDPVKGQEARDDELAETLAKEDEKWAMVCRPKAGQMVVGGGFLALWRRMERMERPKSKEQSDDESS
ncbi:S-adenosyl-L-methionine-dependent methyltransferase [Boeremia exigua]|uniref:S-adenosyl-L-methionine-dependent methyltransferase n=1 Tax=Boeremia exigua TaxID=749465 RepID=UPI001E8DB695|nr:S-adenosyl-L-methionine-dependent methyltransferase [Boeremia exigua]KAH6620377.1 S-adenosyl-L-methionine-dependent methyltransferase [Boeremia exigua]